MSALLLLLFIARLAPSPRAFILAGERIEFDVDLRPRFTERQVRETAPEVRAGFARWAATESGRRLIERFDAKEYEILIGESADEEGPGRAPQPALATLVGAHDHGARKVYAVIINPQFRVTKGKNVFPTAQPSTQIDMMAVAWAGEMLHVDFYSRGISLPHHSRADFQEEWREAARQLGFPDMRHQDDDERVLRYARGE